MKLLTFILCSLLSVTIYAGESLQSYSVADASQQTYIIKPMTGRTYDEIAKDNPEWAKRMEREEIESKKREKAWDERKQKEMQWHKEFRQQLIRDGIL